MKAGLGYVLGWLFLGIAFSAPAEEPAQAEEKKPPQFLLGLPLGLVKGETNRIELRGLNLETVEKLSASPAGDDVQLVLKSKGESDPPKDQKKEAVGDTRLEVELFLASGFEGSDLTFKAEDGHGAVAEWILPVFEANVLLEREENNQLDHPGMIPAEAVVLGSIESPKDVDVYGFTAVAGRRVLLEVRAARLGSPLDVLLMLYDEEGNLLASDDDSGGQRDARLEWTPVAAGNYRVAVLDASDKGSAMHAYVLFVRPSPEGQP